jgi:hypothetical protein
MRADEPVLQNQRKETKMPPIQGYEATLEAAKRALEAAQSALARDVGQAVAQAEWTGFLRDKCDVQALVDIVGELAVKPDFVAKLHATADKMRSQQPQRGRPPKVSSTAATELKSGMQLNGGASAAAV